MSYSPSLSNFAYTSPALNSAMGALRADIYRQFGMDRLSESLRASIASAMPWATSGVPLAVTNAAKFSSLTSTSAQMSSVARTLGSQYFGAASSVAAMTQRHLLTGPTFNVGTLLPSTFDTSALLRSMRTPSPAFASTLSGGVDVAALVSSMVAGADVDRARQRGAFQPATTVDVPGFDEAVREFAAEAAGREGVDVSLPDEPIAYAAQQVGGLLVEDWALERSEALALAVPTALVAADDLARAMRIYVALYMLLALLQGEGLIENGPMPDFLVDFIVAALAATQAARFLPRS